MDKLLEYGLKVFRFWRWVLIQFVHDRCLTRAASLTYTSLLALVPLTVVIFSALRFSPFFEDISHKVQSFVFSNFVPSSGQVVQEYLNRFAGQALQLPVWSFAFLVVTSVTIMIALEFHLNDIWKVKYKRKFSGSVLLYWAMLTLGPMLLGAGLLLSTYIGSLRWFNHINLLEIAHIGLFLPFICTLLAFGFLYLAVPHCTVKFRHAMAGSVIASIMFELSKHIFGLYVHYFPTYALLYGALAAIPLFLLWLYLAWAIFLFGAEVVSGLRLRQAQRSVEQTYPFILGYRLLGHLWAMQGRGKGLSLPKLLDLEPHCPVDTMKAVLVRLQASRFIYSLDEDCYLLSADLHKLSLLDFYTRMEWYLPSTIAHADDAWQQALAERLAVFAKHCQQDLNVPLAQLFDKH